MREHIEIAETIWSVLLFGALMGLPILATMIPGGSRGEDVERRRREQAEGMTRTQRPNY